MILQHIHRPLEEREEERKRALLSIFFFSYDECTHMMYVVTIYHISWFRHSSRSSDLAF